MEAARAALAPWLSGRAPATSGTGDTTTTEAATTTTAPPKKPDADDIVTLGFLQSVELTIRDLYDIALQGKVFTDELMLADITTIREAHEGYEQAISGFVGRRAPNSRIDAMYDQLKGGFSGKLADVLKAAATLENAAVATHDAALGTIKSTDSAALIASIMIVEARHSTLLHMFAGAKSLDDWLADDGAAVSPTDFPAN